MSSTFDGCIGNGYLFCLLTLFIYCPWKHLKNRLLYSLWTCWIEDLLQSLRKKCPYSELFWSAFFHIRTYYGEILYSVQMPENTDQYNSKNGHFSTQWMWCTTYRSGVSNIGITLELINRQTINCGILGHHSM